MPDRHQSDVSSRREFLRSVGAATAIAGVGALPKVGVADCNFDPPLTHLSAKKLAKLIADGKVSAVKVAEAYLKRIEELNPKLNAIVQMDAERIRAEARQADKDLSKGVTKGPLHGVPFTIKECLLTKGIITTNGCPELRSYVPTEDATVVKRLKAAGGILIGKTNVPEMCFGDTENLVYGTTNNPYRLEYSPGGSSGGEGAIIAAGGSPFGVGTDIGGSIRDPSHACGIAGIKPTSHRVPETGMLQTFPLAVGDWNAIGPIARHVEDLYLVLRIISGPDGLDPHTVPVLPVGEQRREWHGHGPTEGHGKHTAMTRAVRTGERGTIWRMLGSGGTGRGRGRFGVTPVPELRRQRAVGCFRRQGGSCVIQSAMTFLGRGDENRKIEDAGWGAIQCVGPRISSRQRTGQRSLPRLKCHS